MQAKCRAEETSLKKHNKSYCSKAFDLQCSYEYIFLHLYITLKYILLHADRL